MVFLFFFFLLQGVSQSLDMKLKKCVNISTEVHHSFIENQLFQFFFFLIKITGEEKEKTQKDSITHEIFGKIVAMIVNN